LPPAAELGTKNVEVVLKIQMIDRVLATPTVAAAYFW
jgi:hypothetical protein